MKPGNPTKLTFGLNGDASETRITKDTMDKLANGYYLKLDFFCVNESDNVEYSNEFINLDTTSAFTNY